ncbi:MAG: dihydropteroate synthase [Candidatus Sumerlaeota bacterium]
MAFECGERTLVMGILNTTPDSFSDGGRYVEPEVALERAGAMVEAGADIIDVGGESSRPGAEPVGAEEELRRVVPVIEAIRKQWNVSLSIDTTKAAVARAALEAGADIINDITALTGDAEMAALAARSRCGVVLMHMRGTPRTMQDDPRYEDCVAEIRDYLADRLQACVAAGIERERLCVDPGIGFGKRLEDNLALVGAAGRFREMGVPVLVGASRKGFVGHITETAMDERLEGSLAVATASVLAGADIVRVHDVRETRRAVAMADALKAYFGNVGE